MLTATLGPPVGHPQQPAPEGGGEQHIAIHRLQGEHKQWADRLLALFQGVAVDGVEWSLKFQLSGLGNERFLLGLSRPHWSHFDFNQLVQHLGMPDVLWSAFRAQLASAVMLYVAFEATEHAVFYRAYLELPPMPDARDPWQAGVHGSGYKWAPASPGQGVVTHYRQRQMDTAAQVQGVVDTYAGNMRHAGFGQAAQALLHQAAQVADPADFLFLDVNETATARRSFTLTFNGADIPVQQAVPELIQLAGGLALPETDVVRAFLPDDPRKMRSMAMGVARDGQEFFTFYYG